MARMLTQPAPSRVWTPWTALCAWWRRDTRSERQTADGELLPSLDAAAEVAARFAERVSVSEDSQPRANAASICRWELLVLRDRVLGQDLGPRRHLIQMEIARHLEAAAAAARTLSNGYRFHSLDHVCDGGQALDDHLAALANLRPSDNASR